MKTQTIGDHPLWPCPLRLVGNFVRHSYVRENHSGKRSTHGGFSISMSNYIAKRETRDPLGVLRIKRATTIEDLLDAVATRDIGSFYFLVQVAGNGGIVRCFVTVGAKLLVFPINKGSFGQFWQLEMHERSMRLLV